MDSITLGTIATVIAFLVAIIGGFATLHRYFKKYVEKMLEEQFKAINERLDNIESSIKESDIDSCKDFLVRFLSDVERGISISEMEMQRFSERYDHYSNSLHQNGYIKAKVDKLKEKGLL